MDLPLSTLPRMEDVPAQALALLGRAAGRASASLAELSVWAGQPAVAARSGPSLLERLADKWSAIDRETRHALLSFALRLTLGVVLGYQMRSLMRDIMQDAKDPDSTPAGRAPINASQLSPERLRAVERRLLARGYRLEEFSAHEVRLLAELVLPGDVRTRFADVGGQASVVAALQEHVVTPLRYPELFVHSHIAQRPTGVLMHGPPGCGKTMLARAMARECGAAFLSISPAALDSKWHGESGRNIAALFSLATKLAPSVIFIDEIDGMLSVRADHEPSWVTSSKTSLLQHWDGLVAATAPGAQRTQRPGGGQQPPAPAPSASATPAATASAMPAATASAAPAATAVAAPVAPSADADVPPAWVVVIGATNRPRSLDEAALRRMPRQIAVPLPDAAGRVDILCRMLAKERCTPEVLGLARAAGGVDGAGSSAVRGRLADATAGCSGSDLAEVVREAVQGPIREALAARLRSDAAAAAAAVVVEEEEEEDAAAPHAAAVTEPRAAVRAVTVDDLLRAAALVRPAADIRRDTGSPQQDAHGTHRSDAMHAFQPEQLMRFFFSLGTAVAGPQPGGNDRNDPA